MFSFIRSEKPPGTSLKNSFKNCPCSNRLFSKILQTLSLQLRCFSWSLEQFLKQNTINTPTYLVIWIGHILVSMIVATTIGIIDTVIAATDHFNELSDLKTKNKKVNKSSSQTFSRIFWRFFSFLIFLRLRPENFVKI